MSVKVSIIIPTYNHAHLISKCLSSIVSQSYQNWEAIVINNFSNDNTIEIVESFKDNRIKLINFHNEGVIAAARNEGIKNSVGELIAFLDSDDYWFENKLDRSISSLGDNDIIFHNLEEFGPNGLSTKINSGRNLKDPILEDLLTKGNQIQNSSVVIRKEILMKVGMLSQDKMLFALEDFDLWLRVSKVSTKFCFLDEVLGGYWVDGNNQSRASSKSIERIKYLYALHINDLLPKKRKYATSLLNYIILREKMLCGEKGLGIQFLKNIKYLKRFRFIRNSLYFLFFDSI